MAIQSGNKCAVVHCGNATVGQGLCAKHYKQMQRHGGPSKEVSAKLIDGRKLSAHPLYETWRSITRIALGTQICDAWKSFEQFVIDVGEKPDNAQSIRRIDSSLKFSKENVAWRLSSGNSSAKTKARDAMRLFYRANPDYARWASIKSKYGITKEDYMTLAGKQNNVCAICKQQEKRTTRLGQTMNLHIDHCHDSKAIRGLLCHTCNVALGLFNDDPALLREASNYLLRNK